MNEFLENCREQIQRIDKVIDECEKHLKHAPEGTLRISKSKKKHQFYHRLNGKDTHGKYLRKSEIALAEQLAQKGYMQKMLRVAVDMKRQMLQCNVAYDWKEIEDLYENLSPIRKELVKPLVLSMEQYALKWEEKNKELLAQVMKREKLERANPQNVNKFELNSENGIFTERGELVRSKSEKILADKLFKMGVPYFYELPLKLKGYGKVVPDFTLLNKRTRKTIYWEHFGMMDDYEYCQKTLKKIEAYEKNGIYIGKQLIVTFEMRGYSMNMKVLEDKIREHLM